MYNHMSLVYYEYISKTLTVIYFYINQALNTTLTYMKLIPCTYHISLAAKRGVLRGQLIDDDVDGQRQKHHDHAHHQDALGACPSWADLVHLSKKDCHSNEHYIYVVVLSIWYSC